MSKTNLIVVAHPDDEVLGFGATGAKLAAQGEVVQPVILCGDVDVRTRRPGDLQLANDIEAANNKVGFNSPHLGDFPNIRMNTVPHVELVQFIENSIERFNPNRIFVHHPADLNDDHRQVSRACMAAFRLFQRRPDIEPLESVHYVEILSSTEWAVDETLAAFRPNLFVEVGDYLIQKLEALKCYTNVMREYPHPRSEEALRGLAAYRGAQSGQICAEAFQTIFQRGF